MIRSPVDIFNGVPINEKDRSPKYLSYAISYKCKEVILMKALENRSEICNWKL